MADVLTNNNFFNRFFQLKKVTKIKQKKLYKKARALIQRYVCCKIGEQEIPDAPNILDRLLPKLLKKHDFWGDSFISSGQSARLASTGYECNQQSLTNSINAVVTGRMPWVSRSVCLCPTCFFRSQHLCTVGNDRKNRSTNSHQVFLEPRQEFYGDD